MKPRAAGQSSVKQHLDLPLDLWAIVFKYACSYKLTAHNVAKHLKLWFRYRLINRTTRLFSVVMPTTFKLIQPVFREYSYQFFKSLFGAFHASGTVNILLQHQVFSLKEVRIIEAFLPCSNVHTLVLDSCRLEDEAVARILASIPQSRVTSLALSGNTIGKKAARELKYLGDAKLIHLTLSDTMLDDQGLCCLTVGLSCSIEVLNLDRNPFTHRGFAFMCWHLLNLIDPDLYISIQGCAFVANSLDVAGAVCLQHSRLRIKKPEGGFFRPLDRLDAFDTFDANACYVEYALIEPRVRLKFKQRPDPHVCGFHGCTLKPYHAGLCRVESVDRAKRRLASREGGKYGMKF